MGLVPNELGEGREDNGVPQEKEDSRHTSLSEGDSVTEMDIVKENEDNSGAVRGELRNLSNKSLPAITKNRRSSQHLTTPKWPFPFLQTRMMHCP